MWRTRTHSPHLQKEEDEEELVSKTPGARITDVESTVDPTATDDVSEALDVGSRWINETSGSVWYCVDNTVGAAVWKNVSAAASGSHPVTVSAAKPTVNDDSNAGYAIGDHWINSTTKQVFQAVDVSVGAAIWKRVDQPKTNIAAVDPAVGNDDTEDYEIGSTWVNTASAPPRVRTAVDVSIGAAEWLRHTNLKNNISTAEPLTTDDADSDYEVGSQWFESTLQELFICTDATVGAAVWLPAGQVGSRVLPGSVLVGSILDYPSSGSGAANQIQYVAVRLFSGRVYDRIATFVDSGGTAGRFIQGGVYDVTDPAVFSDPLNRVAQTDVVDTNTTQPGYYTTALTDGAGTPQTYSPPVTGVYWIAFIQSSNGVKFATTVQFRADFLARRTEIVGSTLLPASPGALTNPASSMILVALIEQGIVLP